MIYILGSIIFIHCLVLIYLIKELYIKKFRADLFIAKIVSFKTVEGKYGLMSYIPLIEYNNDSERVKEALMFNENNAPEFEEIEVLKTSSGIMRNNFRKMYIYIIVNIFFIGLFSMLTYALSIR